MCHVREQPSELSASASRRRPQLIIERTTGAQGHGLVGEPTLPENIAPPDTHPLTQGLELVVEKPVVVPAPVPEVSLFERVENENEVEETKEGEGEEEDEVVYEKMSNGPRRERKTNYNMVPLRYYLRKLPTEPVELTRVRVLWEAPLVVVNKGTPASPPVRDQILTHSCRKCHFENATAAPMQLDPLDGSTSFYSYANPFVMPFTGLSDFESEHCADLEGDILMSMDPWYETKQTDPVVVNALGSEYSPFSTCSSYLFGTREPVVNEQGFGMNSPQPVMT